MGRRDENYFCFALNKAVPYVYQRLTEYHAAMSFCLGRTWTLNVTFQYPDK